MDIQFNDLIIRVLVSYVLTLLFKLKSGKGKKICNKISKIQFA